MRRPLVRFTVSRMMAAVAVVALFFAGGAALVRRGRLYDFVEEAFYPGLVIRIHRPRAVPSYGSGVYGVDMSGLPLAKLGPDKAFVEWVDDQGRSGRISYGVTGGALWVNGWWYGPLQAGDVVDLGAVSVRVNGRIRVPRPPWYATVLMVASGVVIAAGHAALRFRHERAARLSASG